MRYTFTLLLTILFYSSSFGQCDTTCPVIDTCTLWQIGGPLRVERNPSTGINTWFMLNDAQHKSINCSTVTVDASSIKVRFSHKAYKIVTKLAVTDESTIAAAQVKLVASDPFYGEGGYFVGARCFLDYAEIQMSKISRLAWFMMRDSTLGTWTLGAYTPVGINVISPAFQIINGYDYVDIKSETVIAAKGAPSFQVQFNNGDLRYLLDARVSVISPTHHRVYLTNLAGQKVPIAQIPHYTRILVDYGEQCVPVNPLTEKFSVSANLWLYGLMSGYRTP